MNFQLRILIFLSITIPFVCILLPFIHVQTELKMQRARFEATSAILSDNGWHFESGGNFNLPALSPDGDPLLISMSYANGNYTQIVSQPAPEKTHALPLR